MIIIMSITIIVSSSLIALGTNVILENTGKRGNQLMACCPTNWILGSLALVELSLCKEISLKKAIVDRMIIQHQ